MHAANLKEKPMRRRFNRDSSTLPDVAAPHFQVQASLGRGTPLMVDYLLQVLEMLLYKVLEERVASSLVLLTSPPDPSVSVDFSWSNLSLEPGYTPRPRFWSLISTFTAGFGL